MRALDVHAHLGKDVVFGHVITEEIYWMAIRIRSYREQLYSHRYHVFH